MAPDAPVVVVGNGPVGQTTALLLARWGVPSIVLDSRDRRDTGGSRSICQHRDALDVWDTVGAGRQIADEGVTWSRARTFYRGTELFAMEFAEQGEPAFPPFVNISQARTEALLAEQVARSSLIEEHWGHEVTGLSQDEDGVTVEAVGPTGPTGPTGIRAGYAVLAAGGHSRHLREALAVGFPGTSYEDEFLICDVRCELPARERERHFHFDPEWNPGRQVLIHPCPDSTYRIDWQVAPGLDLDEAERTGELDRRIRRVVGDAPYELVWRTLYRFHSRLADRMQVGRVLLAGDCAHVMAPFGARGLNSGVADAENAAWKLAWTLRGWSGPRLLASYHDERWAAARENLDVVGRTMDFLVPHTEKGRRRRVDVLEAALTDPGARAQVDSGRLSEPFWYTDSPLTTPDPSREAASRPERGAVNAPGAGVLLPDAPVRDPVSGSPSRLRLLARAGLLVLVDAAAAQVRDMEEVVTGIPGPVRVLPMGELSPGLPEVLDSRRGEAWVVRPDAHVAAVVPGRDLDGVRGAARGALGMT